MYEEAWVRFDLTLKSLTGSALSPLFPPLALVLESRFTDPIQSPMHAFPLLCSGERCDGGKIPGKAFTFYIMHE